MLNKYPVFIVSKSRWESRLTAKALDKIGVPYRVAVEPQEFDQYAAVIDPAKLLVLPFSNVGSSVPARNFVWERAIAEGHKRHWVLDDNLRSFYRFNNNLKVPLATGTPFAAMEDFCDRYLNVAMAGPNYFMFCSRKSKIPPFTPNTRIYSAILIQNDLPFRWRGRYNEDSDLSLRALKAGWCTILFNAFLCEKMPTMTMKGGNTESLYKLNDGRDGRLLMAQSLQRQHPDVVKVTRKWGRWQHHVDYRPFKDNKLLPRPGLIVPEGVDNFGMELVTIDRKRGAECQAE
jgi:hypothetical protein